MIEPGIANEIEFAMAIRLLDKNDENLERVTDFLKFLNKKLTELDGPYLLREQLVLSKMQLDCFQTMRARLTQQIEDYKARGRPN